MLILLTTIMVYLKKKKLHILLIFERKKRKFTQTIEHTFLIYVRFKLTAFFYLTKKSFNNNSYYQYDKIYFIYIFKNVI